MTRPSWAREEKREGWELRVGVGGVSLSPRRETIIFFFYLSESTEYGVHHTYSVSRISSFQSPCIYVYPYLTLASFVLGHSPLDQIKKGSQACLRGANNGASSGGREKGGEWEVEPANYCDRTCS